MTNPTNNLRRLSGDEVVVVDDTTGLVWQIPSTWPALSFEAAADTCRQLSWAEGCDWRIPTAVELSSVLDYGRLMPALSPLLQGFPENAWTADVVSIIGGNPLIQHVVVDFTIGGVSPRDRSYVMGPAVCVRGRSIRSVCQPGNGTVVDDNSGLEWLTTPSPKPLNWNDALSYCAGLSEEGHDDWRLASAKELLSFLLDPCAPAMPLATRTYWSSTPVASDSGEGGAPLWYFDSVRRSLGTQAPEFASDVLCVRGAL